MKLGEFINSGAFVAMVFASIVVLLPLGIEQFGETTGWFKFSVKKTVASWFSGPSSARQSVGGGVKVDWDRYRRDLEEFTRWAEGCSGSVISLPPTNSVVEVVTETETPERKIWHVPVVSCTAGDPMGRKGGYVFISGFAQPFFEGAMISASDSNALCGYEIVSIGERSVWFRVVADEEGDVPVGRLKLPEFTRVDGWSLVKGNRSYAVADAFQLPSGGWLYVDSFLPPDGTVFKVLNEERQVVMSMLCITIGEKGGRR